MIKVKVGCTGWSYEGWSSTFYPKSLPSSGWLRYYSRVFDCTEVNSTYYRIPTQAITRKWNANTPDDFEFTAKFPSSITHESRLEDVESQIKEFLVAMSPLKKKIFALVLQLPPSLSFDEARPRLEKIFDYLPENYRYPIEGRHESWFSKDAINYLSQKNHCLVWSEIPAVSNTAPVTSDYVYLRLIGDRAIPDSQFGKKIRSQDDVILFWAKKIKELKINRAMVFANNHLEGFAASTANSLRLELGLSVVWEEKKQEKLC